MPTWQLAALGLWLLLACVAVASAASSPAGAEPELTVESVKADAFPRVTARVRLEPEVGRPPSNLDLTDVVILEAGTRKEPIEAYPVGRAPTERVGTYDVVWMSSATAQPGESVAGRLIVARLNRGDLEGAFRFTRPLPKVAESAAAQQRRVELPVVPSSPSSASPDVAYLGGIAGTLAGFATLSMAAALVWRARVRREQARLSVWVAGAAPERTHEAARARARVRKQAPSPPLIVQLGKLGARLVSTSQSAKIKRSLVLAGRGSPQEYTRFVATKTGLALLLLVVGLLLMFGRAPLVNAVALAGAMGVVGFLLPSVWLGRKIKSRQYNMRKALPDALDLMTIGVSAGLAFDGAIGEIVNKWDNDLGREFALLLGELRMGTGRREALLNLADRTQVDEIQTMVGQLIQSEELGMSLAETLLTLSNQMRLRRRQHAEELAQKAAVKMLIPLVFLIFPALFIVILGPSVQDMYTFITQGPK